MTAPITPDERMAYCPVHGDLLAGERSWRCANAVPGHERLSPPPAWDEDTVAEAIVAEVPAPRVDPNVPSWPEDERDYHRNGGWGDFTERAETLDLVRRQKVARAVLAVVREHLPVFAADIDGLAFAIFEHSHEPSLPDDQGGMAEARSRALNYIQKYVEQSESRATVQAETLRAYAADLNLHRAVEDGWEKYGDDLCGDAPDPCLFWDMTHAEQKRINDLADRLDPRGADRG